jgi:hypothetical protein
MEDGEMNERGGRAPFGRSSRVGKEKIVQRSSFRSAMNVQIAVIIEWNFIKATVLYTSVLSILLSWKENVLFLY